MKERLLQFLWQMQYYNNTDLQTENKEPLAILFPGQANSNQGPDFLEAKIRIGTTTWAGNIELHVKASDWMQHQHSEDEHYQNVILHVVWENDYEVQYKTGRPIPILELQNRVPKILLHQYESLMHTMPGIVCSANVATVPEIVWQSWKSRLIAQKLERRTHNILLQLERTNYHWQEVFWWLLARNFGLTVNKNSFEAIARSISINTLARHKAQIHQLESFLLGQAGLLDKQFDEDYPLMLQKEFRFYKRKYLFPPVSTPIKFHRIRPANFPTIRLAQLAMLIHQSSQLFSQFINAGELNEVTRMLQVTANDYWHYHYVFDEKTAFQKKTLGKQMIDNLVVNTVIPVLFAYGHFELKPQYKTKALAWLEEIAAENNKLTRQWVSLGVVNNNAFDSQALNELTMEYCLQKKCLSCSIGCHLLKRSL